MHDFNSLKSWVEEQQPGGLRMYNLTTVLQVDLCPIRVCTSHNSSGSEHDLVWRQTHHRCHWVRGHPGVPKGRQ